MIRRAIGAILSALAALVGLLWIIRRAENRGADQAAADAARQDHETGLEIRIKADEIKQKFETERGALSGADLADRLHKARERMARR